MSGAAQADDAGVVDVHVRGDALIDPVASKDRSVAGSVVTRERLSGPGLQAEDILRTQPGVIVTESGGFGAPSTAAIRGATAADTPIYLGGVRINDDIGGGADPSMIPLWLIDRVEIYRGNAPLEADRLAPGGAIFFEPRRPTRNGGGVGYYGGSWGASRGWVYQGIHTNDVTALVGVSGDTATNRYPFPNDHGTLFVPGSTTEDHRSNTDERTLEAWGIGRVQLGRGAFLDVLVNEISRNRGAVTLALLQTARAREQTERTIASTTAHVPLDAKGATTLDARTSVVVGRTIDTDPDLELPFHTPRTDTVGRRVEQSLAAHIEATRDLRFRPSVLVSREEIAESGIPGGVPLDRAHREFGRLALGLEEQVGPALGLHALLSGECHHTGQHAGESCDVLAPTGRLGAETGWSQVRILANVGHYVRVPTLGEVYGVSAAVHGNVTLVPEAGYTADLGLRAELPRTGLLRGAYLDAFIFARIADGLISYERSSLGYVTPYNVGSARVLGAELLGGVGITDILRADVAVTLQDPRDTTPGRATVNDVLPYRSRLIAAPRLRADWKLRSHDGLSALGGELRAVYQSSRYGDPAGLELIGEQLSIDLEANASWFDGLFTVRGRVADLLDARRTDIIGYPLPGRSVYIGVETSW